MYSTTTSAQVHALSEYAPICSSCGLVLYALHPPHRPCPHCATPLLVQLEELRADTLMEEAVVREREAEEMRLAEGAFPALLSGGGGSAAVRGGVGVDIMCFWLIRV